MDVGCKIPSVKKTRGIHAPNNAHSDCVKQALLSNAASLAIDVAGAVVPGGKAFGTLGRAIGAERGFVNIGRAYQGIVADQQGAKAIKSITSSLGAASGFSSISDTSLVGLASTGATVVGLFVPAASWVSLGLDAYKTYQAVQACPK
jgi:hypothetical protein